MILSFEAMNLSGGQYKKIFGRTLGRACDLVYESHVEAEVKRFLAHTNLTISYGACPVEPQGINITNYYIDGAGDYLPPYVPGNERWKVNVWVTKNDEIVSGITGYGILRDMQKLIDSKW